MLPFETLIIIDRSLSVAVYKQIAKNIAQHIRNGMIKPGTLLPGTRQLAALLGVHRKTVISAYNELYAQGWIEAIDRKGFSVANTLPEVKPQKWDNAPDDYSYQQKIDAPFYPVNPAPFIYNTTSFAPQLIIDDGHPDTRLAPIDTLLREYKSRIKNHYAQKTLSTNLIAGSIKLRETFTTYLAQTRGLQAQVPNILVTHGAQMSIYIAARLLIKPCDYVIVGEPGYYLANQVFESLGANIIRVPVDEHGIDVNLVNEACKKHVVKMLYLVPHHHHPTTATLSPERRMQLLEISNNFRFAIVEDDYDYDFHYNSAPYLPLAGSGHQNRVIYIGSFSKSLSSSIRIGFMVAAEDFIQQAIYLRRMIELRGDHIMEDALATLIENGDINRHLKKATKIYAERRDHLCALFDAHLKSVINYKKPSGGMAIWTIFNEQHQLDAISTRAAKYGLFINNGKLFDSPGKSYNALRMGFASLDKNEMDEAVSIICKCL